ncbi:MAG: hypothetical protein ACXV5U_04550 [Ilumatobacteraceae bacterium]
MITRSSITRTLVALVLASLISGCGSSSKSASTTPATQPTTSTTKASPATQPATSTTPASNPGSAATTQPTTSATTGQPTDDIAAITAAFTKFFDGLDPNIDAKIALLEHGDVLGSMITDAAKDPQFQQLTTTVNSVTLQSDADCAAAKEIAPCALVLHDMFLGGLPAMVGLKSHAVKVDGTWKVSAASWCAVVAIGGATCPTIPPG